MTDQEIIAKLRHDLLAAAARIDAQSQLLAKVAEIESEQAYDLTSRRHRFAVTFALTNAQILMAGSEAAVRAIFRDVILKSVDEAWWTSELDKILKEGKRGS